MNNTLKEILNNSKTKRQGHGAFGENESWYEVDHELFASNLIDAVMQEILLEQPRTAKKAISKVKRKFGIA